MRLTFAFAVCLDPPELPERAAIFHLKGETTMENFLNALAAGNDVVNTFIWTTLGLVLLLALFLFVTYHDILRIVG